MANNNVRIWFITDSSTGWVRSLTEAAFKQGGRVIVTARKPEQLNDLVHQYPDTAKVIRLDVTDRQEVESAIHTAINTFE